MDKTIVGRALVLAALAAPAPAQTAGVLSIPNDTGPSSVIEGYGASARGGADGPVYRVTTLFDSGPGSLRDAILNRSGPRVVVFDVGGAITLLSDLFIQQPYLTVDGSSAPPPGITIRRASLSAGQLVVCGTHDIILRHLRLQGLYDAGGPPIEGGGTLVIDGDTPPDDHAHHIVLDHLTCCNAADGGPDIWGNVSDVTVSWCLMYHNIHPTSLSHTDVPFQPRRRISMHHNVYARNGERNPQVRADTAELDIVNNVIYDYGYFGAGGGYGSRIRNAAGEPQVSCNIINNYFAPTVVPDKALVYGVEPGADWEDGGPGAALPQGSVHTGSLMGSLHVAGNILPPQNLDQYSTVGAPLPTPAAARVTTYAASELRARVLPLVGVRHRLLSEQVILDAAAAAMTGPSTIRGDCDGDGDVDVDDVSRLRGCASRAGVPVSGACLMADLDGDRDCDPDDFGLLQRCFSGSNRLAPGSCLK